MRRVEHDVRDLSDETLALAKAGNKPALTEVFLAVDGLIKWRANTYPVDRATKEDLVSIGRLAVFDALRTYRPGRGSFVPWMTQWVHARMWTAIRGMKRRGEYIEQFAAQRANEEAPPNADVQLVNEARRGELMAAIRKLPPKFRVVMLGRLEGKTLETIGKETDYSREGVRRLELTAIEKVQAELARKAA